jgi:hypothetical protein
VSYKSRGFDEGKKIRVFRDPLTWVWAIVACRFAALGDSEGHSRPLSAHKRAPTDALTGMSSTLRK